MTETERFIVNEDRKVIDTLDPSRKPTGYCCEDDPEDDTHLREIVLWGRLGPLIDDLVFDPSRDRDNYLSASMLTTLVTVIRATKLSGSEVDASKRASGTPKQKNGLLDQTSISLFLDDVGCLLSDILGNNDMVAFDNTMSAVGPDRRGIYPISAPRCLGRTQWMLAIGISSLGIGIMAEV